MHERKHAAGIVVLGIYFIFYFDFLISPLGDKPNSFSPLTVSRRNKKELLVMMQVNMSSNRVKNFGISPLHLSFALFLQGSSHFSALNAPTN